MVSYKINKIVLIICVKYYTHIIRNIWLFRENYLVQMHILIFQTSKNQNNKKKKEKRKWTSREVLGIIIEIKIVINSIKTSLIALHLIIAMIDNRMFHLVPFNLILYWIKLQSKYV